MTNVLCFSEEVLLYSVLLPSTLLESLVMVFQYWNRREICRPWTGVNICRPCTAGMWAQTLWLVFLSRFSCLAFPETPFVKCFSPLFFQTIFGMSCCAQNSGPSRTSSKKRRAVLWALNRRSQTPQSKETKIATPKILTSTPNNARIREVRTRRRCRWRSQKRKKDNNFTSWRILRRRRIRNVRLFIILFVRNFWRVCSQFWLSVPNSVWCPFNRDSRGNPSLSWLGGGG